MQYRIPQAHHRRLLIRQYGQSCLHPGELLLQDDGLLQELEAPPSLTTASPIRFRLPPGAWLRGMDGVLIAAPSMRRCAPWGHSMRPRCHQQAHSCSAVTFRPRRDARQGLRVSP